MNSEQSAYEKWMQHNRRDKAPELWQRTTVEEAGSYNLWDDRHRLNQEER